MSKSIGAFFSCSALHQCLSIEIFWQGLTQGCSTGACQICCLGEPAWLLGQWRCTDVGITYGIPYHPPFAASFSKMHHPTILQHCFRCRDAAAHLHAALLQLHRCCLGKQHSAQDQTCGHTVQATGLGREGVGMDKHPLCTPARLHTYARLSRILC